MKTAFAIYSGIWAFVAVVIFGCMKIDLWLNPWINEVASQFKWYNLISSQHGLSVLYIRDQTTWAIVFFIMTLIVTGLATLTIRLYKD